MKKNIKTLLFWIAIFLLLGCIGTYIFYGLDYKYMFYELIPFCSYFLISFLLGSIHYEKIKNVWEYVGIILFCVGIAFIPWCIFIIKECIIWNGLYKAILLFAAPMLCLLFIGIIICGRNILTKKTLKIIGINSMIGLCVSYFIAKHFNFLYQEIFSGYLPMLLVGIFPILVLLNVGIKYTVHFWKNQKKVQLVLSLSSIASGILTLVFNLLMLDGAFFMAKMYDNSVAISFKLIPLGIIIGFLIRIVFNTLKNSLKLSHTNFLHKEFFFTKKKCPHCAEKIKKDAKICRFCGYQYDNMEVH